ncbi:MAG: methyltransferase domain-containing protein [Deltaproteobacteria bacterium]|nr:methyltransferase domain-containing protein [Deltaproteobacteria bacterium]
MLQRLATKARNAVGIDTSYGSLVLAREVNGATPLYDLCKMNGVELGFRDREFDMVVCIQNGISAFKVNQRDLIKEAIRVTRSGGIALFSSYSERFWEARLEWFQIQSEQGLIGEIDYDATGDGVIVCKDGFRASTVGRQEFVSLTSGFGIVPKISEVEGSSIFCEIPVW